MLNENPQIIFNLFYFKKYFIELEVVNETFWVLFFVNILWETSTEFMQLSPYFNKVFLVDLL